MGVRERVDVKRLASGNTYVADFDAKCGCGNHATHLLTIHAVDACVDETNMTSFTCNACLSKSYERAAELIEQEAHCLTCGLKIDSQSAIIVSLIPVRQGAE